MKLLTKIKNMFGDSVNYRELIDNGAVVVDVRTPSEYQEGHKEGSKNIPLDTLPNRVEELKGEKVILVCRSGGRAGSAKSILTANGIESYNAGAWQNLTMI